MKLKYTAFALATTALMSSAQLLASDPVKLHQPMKQVPEPVQTNPSEPMQPESPDEPVRQSGSGMDSKMSPSSGIEKPKEELNVGQEKTDPSKIDNNPTAPVISVHQAEEKTSTTSMENSDMLKEIQALKEDNEKRMEELKKETASWHNDIKEEKQKLQKIKREFHWASEENARLEVLNNKLKKTTDPKAKQKILYEDLKAKNDYLKITMEKCADKSEKYKEVEIRAINDTVKFFEDELSDLQSKNQRLKAEIEGSAS